MEILGIKNNGCNFENNLPRPKVNHEFFTHETVSAFTHVEQLRVPIALASSRYGLVSIVYELCTSK